MPVVDVTSPIPLYVQIREILRQEIRNGDVEGKPYAIPALAARFGVNRLTIRQAVDELIREGLMYSVKGVGTFAARGRPLEENVDTLASFFDEFVMQGRTVRVQIREMTWVAASESIAAALHIAPGSRVLLIDRLRLVDEVPLAIDYRYVRSPWAEALTLENVQTSVIRHILTQETGVKWEGLEVELEARATTAPEARDLGVEKGSPALVRRVVMYAEGAQVPIIHGISIYRADRYRWKTYVRQLK